MHPRLRFWSLLSLFIFGSVPAARALGFEGGPTYYLRFGGVDDSFHNEVRSALVAKFSENNCWKLGDIQPGSSGGACHRFRTFVSEDKVQGVAGNTESSFLVQIDLLEDGRKEDRRWRVRISFLRREGKKLKVFFNPGRFWIPSDNEFASGKKTMSSEEFTQRLFELIVGLSFK